jgi:hypothetical protein
MAYCKPYRNLQNPIEKVWTMDYALCTMDQDYGRLTLVPNISVCLTISVSQEPGNLGTWEPGNLGTWERVRSSCMTYACMSV